MQEAMDQISQTCDIEHLKISTKQTEVLYQPSPGKAYNELTIRVNGQRLQIVDIFTYVGSTLSRAVHMIDEENAKASVAFGRQENVWVEVGSG